MYIVQWLRYTAVTGSQEEGWGVVDVAPLWTAEVPNVDNETLFSLLIERRAVSENTTLSDYIIDTSYDWQISLDESGSGMPIGAFEIRAKPKKTYEVWRIDAWQNEEDGWWWNDRSKVGEYTTVDDEDYGREFFKFLHDKGMKQDCYIEFHWYSENECEAINSETREPLFQIIEKQGETK